MEDFNSYIPPTSDAKLTKEQERQIRELIAAALANWTGVTRFRTIESTVLTLTDFTSSQHNHSNAAGGGQLSGANAFSAPVTVPNGGTGVNTLTSGGVVIGQGAGNVITVTGLAGTGTFYAAASSGGAVTVRFDYSNGIITART